VAIFSTRSIAALWLCAAFAVEFLEIVIAIVQRVHQVRGGARRHPPADGAVIQHDHFLASVTQLIRNRQSGNARADDADVRRTIFA
jgi:hypothetical protein